ncbi:hypothetical protein SAE01_19980 [Segetibacter aerophilus]|uniref:Uncharacterized protein n=1 Tax=Segetibacter aerophilus TaxID=670293 RepID=A0A512BC37_9BACT|nr:hypothetical protein SAE01_19980 [Segetibacter aerophilus]
MGLKYFLSKKGGKAHSLGCSPYTNYKKTPIRYLVKAAGEDLIISNSFHVRSKHIKSIPIVLNLLSIYLSSFAP